MLLLVTLSERMKSVQSHDLYSNPENYIIAFYVCLRDARSKSLENYPICEALLLSIVESRRWLLKYWSRLYVWWMFGEKKSNRKSKYLELYTFMNAHI